MNRIITRLTLMIVLVMGLLTFTNSLHAEDARGPLRIHPENPRYFTEGTKMPDGSLKAVYLTGSHTWPNLIDRGTADPPQIFDFAGYLDFLQRHDHSFIRLWSRHVTWYHGYGEGELHASPLAWERTGPGIALDGKPRFDLTKFHQPYFDRLHARVSAARDRGIYVSVMLFGGNYECTGGWRGNPFHAQNNVNGIDGDPERQGHGLKIHTLEMTAINRLQETYLRKVIDTLNVLNNVLYEISNEGHGSSAEWQKHWIRYIKRYQATKPNQHPVGMTALYLDQTEEINALLLASEADWISPLTDAAGVRNIPSADGSKVSVLDSDHWFVKELYNDPAFGREWVWKAFCRGHNPILMEHLPPLSFVDPDYPLSLSDPGYTASRRAMGHSRRLAERMNLARMIPGNDLSSTGFCLAIPGREYLVYQPTPESKFTVQLNRGSYTFEWLNPLDGNTHTKGRVELQAGANEFKAPFENDALLYLKVEL